MADLGFADILSLIQSIGVIGALAVTLYFSRRQTLTQKIDLETRVLNDLDEKLHNMASIFLDDPKLVKVIYNAPSEIGRETPFGYYVLFMCAHAYRMRERKVLSDNEWTGWLQWMKNAFQYGTIGKDWKDGGMELWFDPSFRDFVNRELIPLSTAAAKS
jgi:hypothetical protein